MKASFACFILACLPFIAFAGPEDHRYEACFTALQTLPQSVPVSQICFEEIEVSSDKTLLFLIDGLGNKITTLKVTQLKSKTAGRTEFTGETLILNDWSTGCESGEEAYLTVSGTFDKNAGNYMDTVRVAVAYTSAADTCHSHPETQIFSFSRTR